MDWAQLQRSAAKEREVLLIGPRRPPRAPFALIQHAEADGVEFRIGTFKGGSEPERDLRPVKWRMPEGAKECLIDFEGRRWQCWMGAPPVPGNPGKPPSDDPGIVESPPLTPFESAPPPGGPGSGPGPGPGGGSGSETPPQGEPPGRAPDDPPPGGAPPPDPGDPPGTLPPDPPPPAVPPPPENPPGQPPPPPPEPPKGGGAPPPEPPSGDKPPKYEPDPELEEARQVQEPIQDNSAHIQDLNSNLYFSSFSLLGASPSVVVSSAVQESFVAQIQGHFSVDGTLKAGPTCCVVGDLSSISFQQSTGGAIAVSFGSLEAALAYYSGIAGSGTSEIEVCLPGGGLANDVAEVNVEMERMISLVLRGSVVECHLGPILAIVGLEAGIAHTDIVIKNGNSSLAEFPIEEATRSFSGFFGYYGGVRCDVGGFKLGVTIDVATSGFGDVTWTGDILTLSLSAGVGF